MTNLTKRQQQVLNFIKKYVKKNGIPPTRAEISEVLDVSGNAITDHLKRIEQKGYLEIKPRVSRGIVVK